jgi:hypothetical protein
VRGLQQHLGTNAVCSEKHQALLSSNRHAKKVEDAARAKILLQNNERRSTRSQTQAQAVQAIPLAAAHDNDAGGLVFATNDTSDNQGDSELDPDQNSDHDTNNADLEGADFLPADSGAEIGMEVDVTGVEVDDYDLSDNNRKPQAQNNKPSSRGLDDFVEFCNKNKFFAPLTDPEEAGIKLLDVLRKKKSPMNAYSMVMDWHLREKGVLKEGMTLKDAGTANFIGRSTLINRLAKRYNMTNKMPIEKVVRLPSSKEVVRIPIFDAEDCIVELLTNPLLKDEDFDLFDDDPLAPPPDLDYVGNNITGSAYQETHKRLIDGPNQQLVGVIYYIDGATTGHFVDLPVTAVKMSLSMFTREARLKEHMWAILGYLPQVKVAEGRGKKIFRESGHLEAEDVELLAGEGEIIDVDGDLSDDSEDGLTGVKAQDFHFMLSVILDSFIEPLITKGMLWDLVYKNKLYPRIHYKFFVSMVKCDTEEADTLCGKYKTRTSNIRQLCRQCYVPTLEASDHRSNYPAKTQKAIQKLIRKRKIDRLQEISQHQIKNAWYKCRFNLANDRGIHGACPSKMLHAMQLGVFKYCRDIFFDFIGKDAAIAQEINGLAKIYGRLIAHQSERSLPATNFSKGIKDGKLMAKDFRGVLLIMAAVLLSTSGRKMLSTKRKFKKDARKDDWILLVELLLEWEAYLCQPTMKKAHVARLDKKHRYIMYIMKKVAQRTKGMGLNIMKFHGIIHLMEDIQVNGVPLEFDTAANESHHKSSKYAAQLTQRNESTFQIQVAKRLWEFKILNYALEEIRSGVRITDYFDVESDDSSESSSNRLSPSQHGTDNIDGQGCGTNENQADILTDDARIIVFLDEETEDPSFKMSSRSNYAESTSMNIDLLTFLCELQEETSAYLPSHSLPIFTRHQRGSVIFHAHPNYRGKGAWKDWAVIDWGAGYGELPCHLHAFVKLDNMPTGSNKLEYGGIVLKDGVYAVVEEAKLDNDELGKSDLFVPFLKTVKGIDEEGQVTGRSFFLADTEAIVKPCAMIPDIGGPPNRYFYVKARDEWAKEFIAWINRPHKEDDMSDDEGEE